jgi:hypothetical protein
LEGVPLVTLELLREIGDHEPAALCQLARVGVLFARENPQEGGLAAAVRADHAQADARLDVEVEAVQDQPRAVALGDATRGEERHLASR